MKGLIRGRLFDAKTECRVWDLFSLIIRCWEPTAWPANNGPFPNSLVSLFQTECETFHMKMSSAYSFILMQIKVIFIRMVSHLDSLWNRGTRELAYCPQIKMCSCLVPSKCVLVQIIFCSLKPRSCVKMADSFRELSESFKYMKTILVIEW